MRGLSWTGWWRSLAQRPAAGEVSLLVAGGAAVQPRIASPLPHRGGHLPLEQHSYNRLFCRP